ncbi:MAG TPA: hypothetical protein VGH52_07545 [Gaiellaceae bacterium]
MSSSLIARFFVQRERLPIIAAIFLAIGVIWAVIQGSWIAGIVGVVAVAWLLALRRLRPPA